MSRRRRNRGVTLIATVLLSAIAATIALVVVRQTVLIVRAETVRSNFDAAYRASQATRTEFERDLSNDPQFFYKRLFRYERPRICAATPSRNVLPPEDPSQVDDSSASAVHNTLWPADCPSSWTYLDPASGPVSVTDSNNNKTTYDQSLHPIRVQIYLPNATSNLLRVYYIAQVGSSTTGQWVAYRPGSATAITAFSAGDLRMDSLVNAGGANINVNGTFYSGGQTYLPTSSAAYGASQLLSEGGFVGSIPNTGRFYTTTGNGAVTGTAAAAPGSLKDVRQLVLNKLSLDGLRGSYPRLQAVGCSGAVPTNSGSTTTNPRFVSNLCLQAGATVTDRNDAQTVVSTTGVADGTRPAAYLLKFTTTATTPAQSVVSVWTATTPPATPGDCVIRCSLNAVAQADITALRHPASSPATTRTSGSGAAVWQPLGDFNYPANGVIVTDADTYIGQCPGSVAGSTDASTCPTQTPAQPVTIMAGSPSFPADIILGSSLAGTPIAGTSDTAPIGLVATGSMVVPYYGRLVGKDMNINANMVAFGYGLAPTASGLRAFPATQGLKADTPSNYGGALNVKGSLAAPRLDVSLAGWTQVNLTRNPSSVTSPPPSFPGFTNAWVPQGSTRVQDFPVS